MLAGKLVHEQGEVHKLGADAMAIHPSQPLLATGGADRLVKLWHYTQQVMRCILIAVTGVFLFCCCCCFSS